MGLIEKIEIESEKVFNYQETFDKCLINLDEELPPPPTALSIGQHNYKGIMYDNATFTYGEMSTVVAPQKSKKTFFKSALIASYIGGNTTNFFPSVKSKREKELYILDFDTEQGKYYSQRAFRRVTELVGNVYVNYLPFGVKSLSDDDRVSLIDGIVNDPRYKNKIGWISIDGIADLCSNTNDLVKSKKVIEKLMNWNEQGIHINNIIHQTFEKERGTGHLGSFCQKKSESVIFLKTTDTSAKNSPVEVKQKDSRGAPFDTFYFDLDLETILPKECEEPNW